jgi:hypothetical protein
LHRKFSHLNIEKEWFSPESELTQFIRDETDEWDGKDEGRRYAVAKIDVEALAVAKKVAALKGITLAEYLSAIVFPVASRELQAEAKKINRPGKGDPDR